MSLQTFPFVTPEEGPAVGARVGQGFRTEVTTARSGIEKRRKVWLRPRARFEMEWSVQDENSPDAVDAILTFFEARGGRAESFVVFDCDPARSYAGVPVAVMTAGQTVLTLPSRNASGVTVKLNGATKTGTFAATAAANGRDKFTLSAAATGGELATVAFTGQRAFVARFDADELVVEYRGAGLYSVAVSLIEVFGEE